MGVTFGRATPRKDGEKWRSCRGTYVYTCVAVEAPPLLLAAPTPACGPSLRLLLLPLLLLLLPAGAWSQLWKGAEVQVTLKEKQLAAVYHALLAMGPIARTAPTRVITTYPIVGWVRDWTQRLQSGVAQPLTVCHLTGHLPLATPGNDEADVLSQVHWLEGKPASDVAQWLHKCLLHVRQETMWAVARRQGLPLTFEEVSQAQKECPARCADQQTTERALEHLSAAYGQLLVIESSRGTHFIGHALQGWVRQLGIKWTWPWTFQHVDWRWLALLAPWGKGLEAGLLCIPGITANWPPTIMVSFFYSPCVLDVPLGCRCRVMGGMDELWT